MHSELTTWLDRPQPESFPYRAVVAEFRRVGKHFVGDEQLALLDRARGRVGGSDTALARFLDFALDKYDGRYDNPSYIAADLLPMPVTEAERDRLLAILVADTLRLETDALGAASAPSPRLRPGPRIVAKRCRLGLRALEPALQRLGVVVAPGPDDPCVRARRVCDAVEQRFAGPDAERVRALTLLPVSLVHDEQMFIRLLQVYEVTFALIAVQLRAAIDALGTGCAVSAAHSLGTAAELMAGTRPLWSLVATMQPEAFLTFREFTDGASAIQSRHYKLVESLCRRPEPARLHSPAYGSVPDIRDRVLAGQPTVDGALRAARDAGWLSGDADALVRTAALRFADALGHWRHSHYKLALRMLGERRGTGYTEGVPYLDVGRRRSVFLAA